MKFETNFNIGDKAYIVSKTYVGFHFEGYVASACYITNIKFETGYDDDDIVISNVLYDVKDQHEAYFATTLKEDDLYGTLEEAQAEADRRNERQVKYLEGIIQGIKALKRGN